MTKKKRPEGSVEHIFNRILVASFLLHLGLALLVMNVEPPPPPSQEEYAVFLKKIAPPKPVEEKPPVEVKKKVEEEVVEVPPTKEARPVKERPPRVAKPAEAARRAQVRKQISGAGLLAAIGTASSEGSLANVFESEGVVSKDLGKVLAERGGVRVTGGTRIGKKGATGPETSADVGDIEAGAGGSAGAVEGRKGVAPKAFVKSSEAVLKKGGINAEAVALALRRREGQIRQCYERGLKANPSLRGEIVLEWMINDQGRVVLVKDRAAKVIKDTVRDEKVTNCILDILKNIKFPPASEGMVPVQKSFVFESGG